MARFFIFFFISEMLQFKIPEFIADMMEILAHLSRCARPDCRTIHECHADRKWFFMPFVRDLDRAACNDIVADRYYARPHHVRTVHDVRDCPGIDRDHPLGKRALHRPPQGGKYPRPLYPSAAVFCSRGRGPHLRWFPGSRSCRHGRVRQKVRSGARAGQGGPVPGFCG